MSPGKSRSIGIQYAVGRQGVPAPATLRRWAALALSAARGSVTIRVVGGAESSSLNWRYRARRHATNVLSFPAAPLPDGRRPVLGDIVIAAPVVRREATAQGKILRAHWAHLVIHGCLHLLGYDHRTRSGAAAMEEREMRLLARLGFPNPYDAARR